jgi:hypothetical protein
MNQKRVNQIQELYKKGFSISWISGKLKEPKKSVVWYCRFIKQNKKEKIEEEKVKTYRDYVKEVKDKDFAYKDYLKGRL